jgi:D-lyxose ketol-isomerase
LKRSEINNILRKNDAFLREYQFHLPPFAYWAPEEWAQKGEEVRQIVDRQLGWDLTDFGQGDFEHLGLTMFTMRNGSLQDLKSGKSGGELYCEKMLIVEVDQVTPFHFHWLKTEDIINRGGGKLVIQLYNATEDGDFADTDVIVSTDGVVRRVKAGGMIVLEPGESITLVPWCYHKFWAIEAPVLAGEVSLVNDDEADNRFHDPVGRFPTIEEDEPPLYLLVGDYPDYYDPHRS